MLSQVYKVSFKNRLPPVELLSFLNRGQLVLVEGPLLLFVRPRLDSDELLQSAGPDESSGKKKRCI